MGSVVPRTASSIGAHTDDRSRVASAPCLRPGRGVGALKEALDRRTGGHVEAADALATGAGCAVSWEF